MKSKIGLTSAFVALFAAFICIGCFLKIPLGPVPIVLQNGLCILCAVLLGGWKGCLPVALWLLVGLIGLPVYSGGSSGIAVWIGPTGGFLPGYFIGALIAGLIAGRPSVEEKKPSIGLVIKITIATFAGMIILYIPGLIHFAHWALGSSKVPQDKTLFAYVMGSCCLPFLPGDAIKCAVIIPVALKLRPVLAQYLEKNTNNLNTRESKESDSSLES